MRNKGFTLIELLLVIAVICVLAAMVLGGGKAGCVVGCMPEYSTGTKEGYIVGFTQKGIRYKTWEGQLQLGAGQQAALQEPWNFSVPDLSVASDVQKALGKHVRLSYNKWLFHPFYRMETSYEVTKVEVLD